MWTESNSFKISRELPFQQIHEDYILLDSKNAKAHELNVVAFSIWQQLHVEKPYQELLAELMNEFEIDLDSLKRDLSLFINDLLTKDLITITNG
ncbi:hypothetical protein A9Q84_10145 [Halobacteriovorax marinus]|uniref:PqqD family protein n=1 Tax=Halobacteriovorax marinus TaxID=97084 RepID=A0A1Y5F7D4_9BACT|nr:hypothetical protein A9Q84_10145 [Halobacteriovorax marinus]